MTGTVLFVCPHGAAKSVLAKIKSLEHKKKITRVTKHDAKGRIAEFITWESASE